jgi:hypothetical protein
MKILLKTFVGIPAVLFMLALATTVQARCQTIEPFNDAQTSAIATCNQAIWEVGYQAQMRGVQGDKLIRELTGLCDIRFSLLPQAKWYAFLSPLSPAPNPHAMQVIRDTVNVCKRFKGIPATNSSSEFFVVTCSYPIFN